MFERYTQPARQTIFFARATAIINGTPMIDSTHLLRGLMWPKRSRAEVLFHLKERFPQYRPRPQDSRLIARLKTKDLNFASEGKKILVRAAMEADAMGDAWVDTDHLLLGILCESDCQAAQQSTAAGLTLEKARSVVMENRSSRPDYGPVIPLGTSPSPRVWLVSMWRWWKVRRSEKRFAANRQE